MTDTQQVLDFIDRRISDLQRQTSEADAAQQSVSNYQLQEINNLRADVQRLIVQNEETRSREQRFFAESYGPLVARVDRLEGDQLRTQADITACKDGEGAQIKKAVGGGLAAGGAVAALAEALKSFLHQ